jgi:hypothetical protein
MKRSNELAAGNGANDQERLIAGGNCMWQGCVWGFLGQIFRASEEAHERAALLGAVVANGAAQHWVGDLERVKSRPQSGLALDIEQHLAANSG